ncbi:hypothetical protein BC826DRAFT_1102479 [Russula brevipes]|nr:hypothetical protein BC826DRAFT_1102479 [Russula brevipes]
MTWQYDAHGIAKPDARSVDEVLRTTTRWTFRKKKQETRKHAAYAPPHSLSTSSIITTTHPQDSAAYPRSRHGNRARQALEHENTAARAELVALRAYPDSTPHPAELQLPGRTLALRRTSDALTLAEENSLCAHIVQFVEMQSAASRAHFAAESAFGVSAGARARAVAAAPCG